MMLTKNFIKNMKISVVGFICLFFLLIAPIDTVLADDAIDDLKITVTNIDRTIGFGGGMDLLPISIEDVVINIYSINHVVEVVPIVTKIFGEFPIERPFRRRAEK